MLWLECSSHYDPTATNLPALYAASSIPTPTPTPNANSPVPKLPGTRCIVRISPIWPRCSDIQPRSCSLSATSINTHGLFSRSLRSSLPARPRTQLPLWRVMQLLRMCCPSKQCYNDGVRAADGTISIYWWFWSHVATTLRYAHISSSPRIRRRGKSSDGL